MTTTSLPVRPTFVFVCLIIVLAVCCCSCGGQMDTDEKSALFSDGDGVIHARGVIYPQRYNSHDDRAQGHHAIVWEKGRASGKALIETEASDSDILAALVEAGAVPGNNLPRDTWLKRNDPDNPSPDMKVEGSQVAFSIRWDGLEEPVSLDSILEWDEPATFLPRVGGHADQIPYWKSGCVLCLFSCPGGKTSNAGATIRQQVHGKVTWHAREDNTPPDGTPVEILFVVLK